MDALRRKPMLGGLQRLRREGVGAHPPLFLRAHEAAILQLAEVLHKGGQRHLERSGEFADRGRAARQPFEHGPAGRIGQRVEDSSELLVSHIPKLRYGQRFGQYPRFGALTSDERGSRSSFLTAAVAARARPSRSGISSSNGNPAPASAPWSES